MTDSDSEDSEAVEGEVDEIEIKYLKEDDYDIHASTGVKGGVQPRGNFKLDFYIDDFEQAEKEIYELDENGIGDFLRSEGGAAIQRRIQTGVSLSQTEAFETASWIIADLLGEDVTPADIQELIKENYADKLE